MKTTKRNFTPTRIVNDDGGACILNNLGLGNTYFDHDELWEVNTNHVLDKEEVNAKMKTIDNDLTSLCWVSCRTHLGCTSPPSCLGTTGIGSERSGTNLLAKRGVEDA